MMNSIEVYKLAVCNHFSFLKQTTRLDDLYAKSIPLKNHQGYLIPVCELHVSDHNLIEKLAQWREENSFAYPTQFTVTFTGTQQWLRSKLLDVEDRILFLVCDKNGNAIGHLGLSNGFNDECELEIDNVVRGVKNTNSGIMTLAMESLLEWTEEMLSPNQVFLRVFNDNQHAIRYYENLGFVNGGLIPLRKQEEANSVIYRPITETEHLAADKYFLRMNFAPERFIENSLEMISTAGPSISARESSYAIDAAREGWNSKWNYYIKKLESTFAEYIGAKYALSTSSCTGALHIALAALNIGPGDEVIVPDITWVATANAVVYVGATPIFADIDTGSWTLDPVSFESLITKKTKAVIPVHLYGHPAAMEKITAIARKHNLYIIEDAAPAIGAECHGRKVGTFGDFATFSFQGAKLAVTGEGGMLVTNNLDLYERAYALWDQGREPGTFWIKQNGLKYKMSNVQAAIGLGQMERVAELIEAKRRVFSWYAQGLEGVRNIKLNFELPWAQSIYWMTSVLLDEKAGISRNQLQERLKKCNIDTRPVFPAISQYPHWPSAQVAQPKALQISQQAINLPSGGCLKREQVDYICRCLKDIL